MIQKGYTIILSPFLRGLGPYPPKIGVPPYPREGGTSKGVAKMLAFFWVHIFHTRSGGSIQTPLTNGGPFCPLLVGFGWGPYPPGGEGGAPNL